MSNQASEDELVQQIEAITQTMFVTLSEWQAGVTIDWESAKRAGRNELYNLIQQEANRQNAELLEKRELEARLDELQQATDKRYTGINHLRNVGYLRNRIAELTAQLDDKLSLQALKKRVEETMKEGN